MEIEIVTRKEWGARAPLSPYYYPTALESMAYELWLHHSASSGSDERTVQAIQRYHQSPDPSRNKAAWKDIAYTFLIDNDSPDIDIFEGRPIGAAGGHTKGHNTHSYAICVIGNFQNRPPNEDTIEKIVELAVYGHMRGWWPLGFTGGHRDASGANTSCPGNALHAMLGDINRRIVRRYLEEMAKFADVPKGHWAYEDIEWLADNGITSGVGKNDAGKAIYGPDLPVTRAQFAAFARRIVGLLDAEKAR